MTARPALARSAVPPMRRMFLCDIAAVVRSATLRWDPRGLSAMLVKSPKTKSRNQREKAPECGKRKSEERRQTVRPATFKMQRPAAIIIIFLSLLCEIAAIRSGASEKAGKVGVKLIDTNAASLLTLPTGGSREIRTRRSLCDTNIASTLTLRGGATRHTPLLTYLDFFGTSAFAFSGTLTSTRHSMSVVGALLLSLITACGGGTVRDFLITPKRQAFWVTDVNYFRCCLVTSLATLYLYPKLANRLKIHDSHWPFCLADAIGLAAFAVIGARKGLEATDSLEVSALSGLLSACGGGVIRDVLAGDKPRIFHADRTMYASPAIGGGARLRTAEEVRVGGGGCTCGGVCCSAGVEGGRIHKGVEGDGGEGTQGSGVECNSLI